MTSMNDEAEMLNFVEHMTTLTTYLHVQFFGDLFLNTILQS